MLVIVVLGVLAAIDSVTGTAGANKARTVAATLAEKDQEQLRALRTVELDDLNALIPAPARRSRSATSSTRSRPTPSGSPTLGGADISCALDERQAAAILRITSTVTSPITARRSSRSCMTSIVAPQPGSGTLAALVKNAAGAAGHERSPSRRVGPTAGTKTTNAAGCAVFGAVDAGTYTSGSTPAGWVDEEGDQLVVKDDDCRRAAA